MAKYMVLAFLCVSLFVSAQGLKCYDCKGAEDKVCETTVTCGTNINPNDKPACIKRIFKVQGTGRQEVKRGCAFVQGPTFKKAAECREDDMTCEACVEDLCNAGTTIGRFGVYSLLVACLPLLFSQLFGH